MYAVFVVSQIDTQRLDEAEVMLRDKLVPNIKAAPGFISGTWARDDDTGEARSIAIFETKEAAQKTFEKLAAGFSPDGPVQIQSASFLGVTVQV